MAVVSFMDAKDFDPTKSYFNKLKSKEEIAYIVLQDYSNEELNETVKGVITDGGVEEFTQGVIYFKLIDYNDSNLELEEFLEQQVDPTDIYTYVVRLGETFNDLRVLTRLVSKYSDTKIRFIGGNLLALEGTGVGFFPDSFVSTFKLKTKPSVRFDYTRVKMVEPKDLVVRELSEFHARKTQVKKSSVKKKQSSTGGTKKKTAKKRSSVMDILSSY